MRRIARPRALTTPETVIVEQEVIHAHGEDAVLVPRRLHDVAHEHDDAHVVFLGAPSPALALGLIVPLSVFAACGDSLNRSLGAGLTACSRAARSSSFVLVQEEFAEPGERERELAPPRLLDDPRLEQPLPLFFWSTFFLPFNSFLQFFFLFRMKATLGGRAAASPPSNGPAQSCGSCTWKGEAAACSPSVLHAKDAGQPRGGCEPAMRRIRLAQPIPIPRYQPCGGCEPAMRRMCVLHAGGANPLHSLHVLLQ